MDTDEAVQDFCSRIKQYETAYEPLDVDYDKCGSLNILTTLNIYVTENAAGLN